MSSDAHRKRWRFPAYLLPGMTLLAFMVAARFKLDTEFNAIIVQILPSSLVYWSDALPFVGWLILTVLCSGWLCCDHCKYREVSGWMLWTRVICLTPLVAIFHIIGSVVIAAPGCVLLLGRR